MTYAATTIAKALQYLYYTGDGINRLGGTPPSDRAYDDFCRQHGIQCGGGSDIESSYTLVERKLAEEISDRGGIEGLL